MPRYGRRYARDRYGRFTARGRATSIYPYIYAPLAGAALWAARRAGRAVGSWFKGGSKPANIRLRRKLRKRIRRRVGGAARIGYFGSRQVSKYAKRVRYPRRVAAKTDRYDIGIAAQPVNFVAWNLSTTFQEMQWNGYYDAMASQSYGTQNTTANAAPIQGIGDSQREGNRIGLKHELCLCVDSGDGIQLTGSTVLKEDKAICCRMLVIQIFGDTDSHGANTLNLGHFFASSNITSFMKKNIGDANPQLKKFKVLVDRTFTSSELSAAAADRHVRLKFNQGTCTLNNTDTTSFINKGSRIIWGMFFEDVQVGGASNTSKYTAFPKYYGSYKITWWDVKG